MEAHILELPFDLGDLGFRVGDARLQFGGLGFDCQLRKTVRETYRSGVLGS